jgi:hypothetical protein
MLLLTIGVAVLDEHASLAHLETDASLLLAALGTAVDRRHQYYLLNDNTNSLLRPRAATVTTPLRKSQRRESREFNFLAGFTIADNGNSGNTREIVIVGSNSWTQ